MWKFSGHLTFLVCGLLFLATKPVFGQRLQCGAKETQGECGVECGDGSETACTALGCCFEHASDGFGTRCYNPGTVSVRPECLDFPHKCHHDDDDDREYDEYHNNSDDHIHFHDEADPGRRVQLWPGN
ncbi:hypothetical protein BV898_08203 [Hypsibius exemplaris]|uniref:P-type domain-containing protein n=1 Tax=Hypsibius exemplaris TaxID=2072580 RepID=A0A1W0WRB7_HYPEX|nr:hypothetical protein BV898_08203 [Hypsibius exemplaris]